jgi:hypothetical protein
VLALSEKAGLLREPPQRGGVVGPYAEAVWHPKLCFHRTTTRNCCTTPTNPLGMGIYNKWIRS